MSKIFKVFTVHRGNDDRYDGPITDVCSTEELAKKIAAGSGWYGGNAPINHRWAIEIANGDVYLLDRVDPIDLDGKVSKQKDTLKKQALSKLTQEEREALGLDSDAE